MIIFDLDGTLSIVGDRVKYLRQPKKDWDSFYEACGEDEGNWSVINLYKAIVNSGYIVKIVTGRRESVRKKTLYWLHKNGIGTKTEDLHMRKNGDFRHDTIVKPELIEGFIGSVQMVFEDRNSMVKKWRELGLTCLQVADGDF